MGYRLRLGKIAKSEREKYRGMTEGEVQNSMAELCNWYYPKEHIQLYELGKYIDYSEGMENFYDFESNDCEFKIASKDDLKRIIETYHENTSKWYKSLLVTDEDGESKDKIIRAIKSKIKKWSENAFGVKPYYLLDGNIGTDGFITGDWSFEYAIFNLVYIYRTFDWENDYLIYSGW